MLKKNEVIEALENGGYILLDDWTNRAHVYSVSDAHIGVCRWDTAEKIGAVEPYEKVENHGYNKQPRILNPYAMAAEKAAAAHELASIRTPGNIEIRAKNDCRIGGNYVAEGRRYIIRVYGDGTQEQPGNAYGSLYDFRTHEHAVYFEIVSRPEADDLAAQSARVEAETREALARAGMLAEEAAPAEEAPAQQPTSYLRADGDTATHSASVALGWHRAGHDVIVARYGDRSVYVHGAAQKPARSAENENRAHCRHIAEEIDAYAAGELKRCPDCGEIHRRDWGDVGDAFKCPNCGEVRSLDDWELLGVYDFLADCYDIEYRVSGRALDSLRSVRIMVACGGPNIYLDTASKDVELYWWTESARYPMSYEAVEALDNWAAEMWGCL